MTLEYYLLDTNIVSRITHPKNPNNQEVTGWFLDFLSRDQIKIFLPEIVAYEVRRGLLYKKLKDTNCKSLQRFEAVSKQLTYLPINTNVFRIAENLWANARINGTPTASNVSLDNDVLLAAQTIDLNNGATIVTENIKHLKNYVKAYSWKEL